MTQRILNIGIQPIETRPRNLRIIRYKIHYAGTRGRNALGTLLDVIKRPEKCNLSYKSLVTKLAKRCE